LLISRFLLISYLKSSSEELSCISFLLITGLLVVDGAMFRFLGISSSESSFAEYFFTSLDGRLLEISFYLLEKLFVGAWFVTNDLFSFK